MTNRPSSPKHRMIGLDGVTSGGLPAELPVSLKAVTDSHIKRDRSPVSPGSEIRNRSWNLDQHDGLVIVELLGTPEFTDLPVYMVEDHLEG